MISAEIRPGQACGKAEEIAQELREDFGNIAARTHLTGCVDCRNVLAGSKNYGENIRDLVRNIRDGIACSG